MNVTYTGSLHSMYWIVSLLPILRSYQRINPGLSHMYVFHNRASFYGEELLALCPTPKLEDHCLLVVHNCLFNIFTATFHFGGCSSNHNLRTCHDMVAGTHLRWFIVALYIFSSGIPEVCIQSLFYLLRHLHWPVHLIWMWTEVEYCHSIMKR